MIDIVLGLGQGGCRIAKTFKEEFDVEKALYFNLAAVDFSQFKVPIKQQFLINGSGTGRSPEIGERIVRNNYEKLVDFLDENLPKKGKQNVCVAVGGGGGSGCGFLFPVLKYIRHRKWNAFTVITMPAKNEGLPAKPNALRTLNRLIKNYIGPKALPVMVVDNGYCIQRYGTPKTGMSESYWNRINTGIAKSLLRFWYLTNLERYTNFIDVTAGYGALDENELIRVMYSNGGFLDIREYITEEPDLEEAAEAIFESLVFGNLDIKSTKAYIVAVGFPNRLRKDKRIQPFLETIFERLQKLTKTPFVLRSSHFNSNIDDIRVNVLMAGLVRSKGLDRVLRQTRKDVKRYNSKGGIEMMNLDGIDFQG